MKREPEPAPSDDGAAPAATAEGKTQELATKKPKVKPKAAEAEVFVKELEDAKTRADARPLMVLVYDESSDFCLGALQQALNSKAAQKLAKESFQLLKLDWSEVQKSKLDKKLGVTKPQLLFLTPGGKVVARFSEPNMTATSFLGLLEGLAVKAHKAAKAEAEDRAKKEKAAAREAAKKDATPAKGE